MTESPPPDHRQSLLDAATRLRKALQDSLADEIARLQARRRYEAAHALFSQTYKAWEQATQAAAGAKFDMTSRSREREATTLALKNQRESMRGASRVLWRACFSGDEPSILSAAVCFEAQNKEFASRLAADTKAGQDFYWAQKRAGELGLAQRNAHVAHLAAATELAEAEKDVQTKQFPNREIADVRFIAEQDVDKFACLFAGGELSKSFLTFPETALGLGFTSADLHPLDGEDSSTTA